MDRVLFETLINYLLVSVFRSRLVVVALIAHGLLPCVDIDSQENLSCTWIDTCSRNCYGVGVYYIPISDDGCMI